MAIINCPECNEKISSTVKQCIHCGAKITVCPECETVYVDVPDVCTECGYKFQNTVSAHPTANNAVTDTKDIKTANDAVKKWKSENFLRNVRFMQWPLIIISVLFVFVLLKFFTPIFDHFSKYGDYKLSSLPSVKMYIWLSFFLFIAFTAVVTLFDGGFIMKSDYAKWIEINKINNKSIIESSININYTKLLRNDAINESKALKLSIIAEILNTDADIRSKHKISFVLDIVQSCVSLFLLACFFTASANKVVIARAIYRSGYRFIHSINWGWLIIFVIFTTIMIIIKICIDKKIAAANRKFVEKNYPNKLGMYDKYLKNPSVTNFW